MFARGGCIAAIEITCARVCELQCCSRVSHLHHVRHTHPVTPLPLIVPQRTGAYSEQVPDTTSTDGPTDQQANQMSFGLEALFEERLEVFPAEPVAVRHLTAGHCEVIIKSLIKERDDLHTQVQEQASTIEHLERRVYAKVAADAELPVDVVCRLHRLESECQQLRDRNTRTNENLKAAESETATLRDTIAEKSQKVKGALRKTKNAKEVAGKVEEKAKDAANDKQRHLASERKMRAERNEALAALTQERKITEDLRVELDIEQSGQPHLRDTEGSKSNFTTFVIPIDFRIRRIDHYRTMRRLRSNPSYLDARVQEWYEKWTTQQDEKEDADDGDYDEDDDECELEDDSENKLYGGMAKGGEMKTGAEHDGWRPMRGLQKICRNAAARHNA
jgi:hypothetical protein